MCGGVPAASSSPHGPPSAASSGPRRARHSLSAGLSGVMLSTPSGAGGPVPLPLALFAFDPEPAEPPPTAARRLRSTPPAVALFAISPLRSTHPCVSVSATLSRMFDSL